MSLVLVRCWKGEPSPTLVMRYILGVFESLLKLPRQRNERLSLDAAIAMLSDESAEQELESWRLDGARVLCPQPHAGLDQRPRLQGTRQG